MSIWKKLLRQVVDIPCKAYCSLSWKYPNHFLNLFYFCRYDYENCEADPSNKMMIDLEHKIVQCDFPGTKYEKEGKVFIVEKADNFQYVDPIDNSVAKNQVLCRNNSFIQVIFSLILFF